MADAKSKRRRSASRMFRRLLTGGALIAVGGCIGVALGALLDGPRVLLRRLSEPVQSVELAPSPSATAGDELEEFRALQVMETSAQPEPAPAPAILSRNPGPQAGVGHVAAAPGPSARAVSVEEVIAAIEERRASTRDRDPPALPQPPLAATRHRVVQVAAYGDLPSAEALVQRLHVRGFDSYVSGTHPKGQARHRVRVRAREGETAEGIAAQLKARGYGVWITTEGR